MQQVRGELRGQNQLQQHLKGTQYMTRKRSQLSVLNNLGSHLPSCHTDGRHTAIPRSTIGGDILPPPNRCIANPSSGVIFHATACA
jgi:hypothetical protein